MRITSRTFKGSVSELQQTLRFGYFPGWRDMIQIARDYQRMAWERREHWWSHADLQVHLAMSLHVELQALRALKDGPEADTENRFTQQIVRSTINAYTQIADGMAHRFLGYRYGLCQILLENKTSPYAVTQEGFGHVMEVAALLHDHAGPDTQVLLCDLNTITNVGDIIIRSADGLEIIEVKRGKRARGARLKRQVARMDEFTSFVNSGEGHVNGLPAKLIALPPRRHELAMLEDAFVHASSNGFATIEPYPYQAVVCIDPSSIDAASIEEVFERILQNQRLRWETDDVLEYSSLDARQAPGMVAPYTTMPLPPELVVDLLMGQRIFISTISIPALADWLIAKGFDVYDLRKVPRNTPGLPDGSVMLVAPSQVPAKNFIVSIDMLLEMAGNLIGMESFLASGHVLMAASEEKAHWIPDYENESALWR